MVPYQPFAAKLVMSTQGKSIYCMDQLSVYRLPLYVISKRVLSNKLGYLISHIIIIKMDHIHISLLISKFSRQKFKTKTEKKMGRNEMQQEQYVVVCSIAGRFLNVSWIQSRQQSPSKRGAQSRRRRRTLGQRGKFCKETSPQNQFCAQCTVKYLKV